MTTLGRDENNKNIEKMIEGAKKISPYDIYYIVVKQNRRGL